MKKWIRRVFILIGILFLGFFIFTSVVTNMLTFSISNSKLNKTLQQGKAQFSINNIDANGQNIRYVKVDGNDSCTIVFIHGAPGSLKDYKTYLLDDNLLAKTSIVAIDRPGYGNSNYGKVEPSILKQAEAVSTVLKEIKTDKIIIAGHSYGGPVAAAVAMLHNDNIDGLLLKAPAIDPNNEKQFWFAGLGAIPPVKWISKGLYVAAVEKKTHVKGLMEILPLWNQIKVPVTMVHGQKDMIVPSKNIDFIKTKIPEDQLKVVTNDSMDHIMIWSDYDFSCERNL